MSDLKLGLGMICKDEVEEIKRILSSYRDLFDEVQITITDESKREELEAVIKEYNGTPSFFEWKSRHRLFPFDEARNFNKSQFKNSDYYVRLDTDDSIQGADKLRKVAKKAKDHGISVVLCFYDYARDEWGNTVAGHNRETIIQCSDNLFWNKRIHENILPKDESIYSCVIDDNIRIFHHITDEKSANSAKRNLEYLIDEYNENKENTDPRTLAYLGRVFTGLGELDKAIHFLEKHIHSSGWDEDKYVSWCYLADIFRWKGDYQNSLSCCYEALSERTDYPDAYYKLMDAYHDMGKWEKAIEWGTIGATKKTPNTTMIFDPSSHTWRPAITMALCYFKLGKFDEAKRFFDYAAKLAPGHEFITANKKLFDDAVLHKKYTENFAWMVNFLKDRDVEKLPSLVNSIPNELMEEPAIIGIRNHFLPSTKWKDGSVVFYCGQAWEEWSPKSVKSGIGGSEEAVINVAKELVKLGHEVTVYNSCGEAEGVHDGVRYVNYYKFNKKDEFDVLVAWRCSLFKFGVKAKKKVIWLHDVPEYILNEYDEKAFTDKAIVLSEYHKSLLAKKFPEEKIFVSSNGVDASQFIGEVERNPYRMIYASSYDRGLEHLLNIWPEVKREVPQAELHVFYGWNTYDRMYEEGSVDGSLKKRLLPLLSQDGVTEHGRVGHEELALEYMKSGIWAYPTHFPEISPVHGDTIVETLSGGEKIKDLVGKSGFYVYSCNADGELSTSKVNGVFLTRKNTEMIKIGFKPDFGRSANKIKYLTLTPDHEVMLRDGSYKPAGELKYGDSVKAFHRQKNAWGNGYDMIGVTDKGISPEHRFVASKHIGAIPDGFDVDHLDSNTRNNSPENLSIKSRSDHWKDTWSRKDVVSRKKWADSRSDVLRSYHKSFSKEELSELKRKACLVRWKEKSLSNHKVVSIESVENSDAFCMEVEPDHNFVANGIFVHNCIAAMKAQVAGCVPVCTGFAALNETVKAGLVIPGSANDKAVMEDFKKCLIELLKNPTEQEGFRELVLKHKDEFGWDKVAKQWSMELFPSMPPREFIDCRFKWIKDRCDLKDKIVDIGGNDGHTFEGWNRDNVTTVDIDEYEVPNFVRANACDVPLPDKSFDVVCLNEILEHIPDPVKALKEGKRLGRKKIIITVPNEWEWPKRYDPMMTIEEKEKKEGKSREVLALEGNTKVKDMYKVDNLEHLWHIRYYTKELLEEHLKEAGLNNYLITKLTLGDWAFYGCEVFLDE